MTLNTYEKKFSEAESVIFGDVSVSRSGRWSIHKHCYAERDHHNEQVLDAMISFPRPQHAQNHHWYWLRRFPQHLPTDINK